MCKHGKPTTIDNEKGCEKKADRVVVNTFYEAKFYNFFRFFFSFSLLIFPKVLDVPNVVRTMIWFWLVTVRRMTPTTVIMKMLMLTISSRRCGIDWGSIFIVPGPRIPPNIFRMSGTICDNLRIQRHILWNHFLHTNHRIQCLHLYLSDKDANDAINR